MSKIQSPRPANGEGNRLTHSPADLPGLLGIHRSTVYKLLKDGSIRSVRAGRKYLIPADAVAEFLKGAQ